MKSRSLALSLLTAMLSGSAYDPTAAQACNQPGFSRTEQLADCKTVSAEEKNRVRSDAIRSLAAGLRDQG